MEENYICQVCGSKEGVPAGHGSQNWFWLTKNNERTNGPFCCLLCAQKFAGADDVQRALYALGDPKIVENLAALKAKQDEPEEGVYKMNWRRLPICEFSDRLDNDPEFGFVKGVARTNYHANALDLREDRPAFYIELELE